MSGVVIGNSQLGNLAGLLPQISDSTGPVKKLDPAPVADITPQEERHLNEKMLDAVVLKMRTRPVFAASA